MNSIKKNRYRSKALHQGLIMLILFLLIMGMGISVKEAETIAFVILSLIVCYFVGLIMLVTLLLKIGKAKEYGAVYFVICVIGYVLIAFSWLSRIGVAETVFEYIDALTNRDAFGLLGAGYSTMQNLNDFVDISLCMLLHCVHGLIIWLLGFAFKPKENTAYYAESQPSNLNTVMPSNNEKSEEIEQTVIIPQNQRTISSLSISDLYIKMNQSSCRNHVDSNYWIYEVKQFMQNNKSYITICFFNRSLNESGQLQKLYYSLNGQEYVQDRFFLVQEYNNPNILNFSVQLSQTYQATQIEITGYICQNKRTVLQGAYIPFFEVNVDMYRINWIAKKHYANNPDMCQMVPCVLDEIWICACGRVNQSNARFCAKCGHSREDAIAMINDDPVQQLGNLTSQIQVDLDHTIEQSIAMYASSQGLDSELVSSAVNQTVLCQKQQDMVHEYLSSVLKSRPIQYDVSRSFDANINQYTQSIIKGIITQEMVMNQLDLEKEKKVYHMLSTSSLKR